MIVVCKFFWTATQVTKSEAHEKNAPARTVNSDNIHSGRPNHKSKRCVGLKEICSESREIKVAHTTNHDEKSGEHVKK
jgi:hypothetical protein